VPRKETNRTKMGLRSNINDFNADGVSGRHRSSPHNGDLYFSSGSWRLVIQLQKTNFTFKTLPYPLHCQFLALFRAVKKIKVD